MGVPRNVLKAVMNAEKIFRGIREDEFQNHTFGFISLSLVFAWLRKERYL